MAKATIQYVCSSCGAKAPQMLGRCPVCGAWGTYEEEVIESNQKSVFRSQKSAGKPQRLQDVVATEEMRIDMHNGEFNRVLGGGLVPGSSAARNKGLLWEQGYHDRVLSGEGQLQRLVDYIRENPRRSLMRRQHAEWFRPFSITVAGTNLQAYGNIELLHAPHRQAVRISSRITAEERNCQPSTARAAIGCPSGYYSYFYFHQYW